MYERGLFLGRFQPIHKGHIQVIQILLKEVKELIIGIGSAQYTHSFNNPFTAGERILMIKNALLEYNIDLIKIYIIPINDTNDNRTWVSHIIATVPEFDVAYTNNPLVFRLIKEFGIEVKNTESFERETLSSTLVRKRILNNEKWQNIVPKSVSSLIKQIDGINRIKEIGKISLKI